MHEITEKTIVAKPQPKAETDNHTSAAGKKTLKDTFVVVDGRGGISVDLGRMLSSERGKRSIEKLRKVPVKKN